jgi:hypothetical protein
MPNIIVELKEYIEANISLYAPLLIDFFQGNLQELMIRHEPSTYKTFSYLNGTSNGTFNFSINAKSLNGKTAVDQLNVLLSKLDLVNTDISPLVTVKIEPISGVRLVSKTEKNEFIYSASFLLEYTKKRG